MYATERYDNIWFAMRDDSSTTTTYRQCSWEPVFDGMDPSNTKTYRENIAVARYHATGLDVETLGEISSKATLTTTTVRNALGTYPSDTDVVWRRYVRDYPFLAVPLNSYLEQLEASIGPTKDQQGAAMAFCLGLIENTFEEIPHTTSECRLYLMSPFTCTIALEEYQGTRFAWSFLNPMQSEWTIPVEVLHFISDECISDPLRLGDKRSLSLCYTLIYMAYKQDSKLKPWMESVLAEDICRNRRDFVNSISPKTVSSKFWRPLTQTPAWIAMCEALKRPDPPVSSDVSGWLLSMKTAIAANTQGTFHAQDFLPWTDSLFPRLPSQSLHYEAAGAAKHYGVRTEPSFKGPFTLAPSARSLSVPLSAESARYSSHADGSLKASASDEPATARDRDEAFDWQLKLPHQSVLSFPVTVPLDHPSAPKYYRSIVFIDEDPETFELFRPDFDQDEARKKRNVEKIGKDEKLARMIETVLDHFTEIWSDIPGFEEAWCQALDALCIHSSFQTKTGSDPTAETETVDIPDIFFTIFSRIYWSRKDSKLVTLQSCWCEACGELKSEKHDCHPELQVLRYNRRVLISQPSRNGTFGFLLLPVKKDEVRKTIVEKLEARGLNDITDKTEFQLLELHWTDREGRAKTPRYSIDVNPSWFVNHLVLLTGIMHWDVLWDCKMTVPSAFPPACFEDLVLASKEVPGEFLASEMSPISRIHGYEVNTDDPIFGRNLYGIFGRATIVWRLSPPGALKVIWAGVPSTVHPLLAHYNAEDGVWPAASDAPNEVVLNNVFRSLFTLEERIHFAMADEAFLGMRTDVLRAFFGIPSPNPRVLTGMKMACTGEALSEYVKHILALSAQEDMSDEDSLNMQVMSGLCFDAVGSAFKGWQALHNKGYLHGDISPANIMVAENGQHFLIDLGLSIPAYGGFRPPSGTKEFLAMRILGGKDGVQMLVSAVDDIESFLWVALYVMSSIRRDATFFSTEPGGIPPSVIKQNRENGVGGQGVTKFLNDANLVPAPGQFLPPDWRSKFRSRMDDVQEIYATVVNQKSPLDGFLTVEKVDSVIKTFSELTSHHWLASK